MKKQKIAITLFLLLSSYSAFSCDICGCGIGNSYIGILPDFTKHIFGLRYRSNALLSHVGVDGATTYLTTQENYHTVEAWGGWDIGKKWRIMFIVPYNFAQKSSSVGTFRKDGLGDMHISVYYHLFHKKSIVLQRRLLVQHLSIGGGVKLATGYYQTAVQNNTDANLFQLGTGSYDFNISLLYDFRLQDAGVNVASTYRMTSENKENYKYGNRWNISTQAYYKFRVKDQLTISPNVGIQYETSKEDLNHQLLVSASGGNLVLGTAGVECNLGKFAFGANVQTPLSQNLANGILKAQERWMVHLSFLL